MYVERDHSIVYNKSGDTSLMFYYCLEMFDSQTCENIFWQLYNTCAFYAHFCKAMKFLVNVGKRVY